MRSKAATMSLVLVGENKIPRDFKRYCSQFSLLEIDCEPGKVPGKARLLACASEAPEGFVFSLVVPSLLSSLEDHPDLEKEWLRITKLATMLKASWWVIRTPAAVRPTARSRRRLGELIVRLRGLGQQVAWEAGGVWDDAAVVSTAAEHGAVAVQDVASAMPLPTSALYCRVLALGRASRIGLGLAERIAERAALFPSALIVVEGSGAGVVVRVLKELNESEQEPGEDTDWGDLADEVESQGAESEPKQGEA